jgi:hypothetical protein
MSYDELRGSGSPQSDRTPLSSLHPRSTLGPQTVGERFLLCAPRSTPKVQVSRVQNPAGLAPWPITCAIRARSKRQVA